MTGIHEAPPEPGGERRAWMVLVTIIAVCFLAGLAFLAFSVWLDWE